MKFLLILLCIATIQAGEIKDDCPGIKINGTYYEIEILHERLDYPSTLVVDYRKNILYFISRITDFGFGLKISCINLNTKEFRDIKVSPTDSDGSALTVDQVNHVVYIGGSKGIYEYNYDYNRAEIIGENVRGLHVWNLYYKDVLYYSVLPYQFLNTYINGTSTKFKDLEHTDVFRIVIDNEDTIFFTNASGLFSQKKGSKDSVFYEKQPLFLRGINLSTDINGKVYVCLLDGIYVANKETVTLDIVVYVKNALAVAFDNENNMIVSNNIGIMRIKQVKDKKC